MNLFRGGLKSLSIFSIITLISMAIMLLCTPPELSWDEADYVAATNKSWRSLWGGYDYNRHSHGPMAIYLAKFGNEVLPDAVRPVEARLRFFGTLVGSLAVGLVFLTLRRSFGTSLPAALAGSGLLLFSVIRVEETNIIGPHHLMLACTIAILALGYQWRERPTLQAVVGLGAVMAFGTLSMTYVIPVALCWIIAISLTKGEWITWDRTYIKVSWAIPVILAVCAIVVAVMWPPGVLQRVIVSDFRFLLNYGYIATLVGDRMFEVTPRSAVAYWLTHLDAPILVFSALVLLLAYYKAFRNTRLSPKHVYLMVFLVFLGATTVKAHLAGARNLLQFLGVLSLATGALFDEAVGHNPLMIRFSSAAVIALAALNLIWISNSSYTPFLGTGGYRALLNEESNRLHEKAKVLVYGSPILKFYAQQQGNSMAWDVADIPWTTRADAPLSAEVKYVLIPAFVYNHMPPDQPMRRIVADHWKVVWSFKAHRIWELRLYENPQSASH